MRIIAFILGLLATAAALAITFGFDINHPAGLALPNATKLFTPEMLGELGGSAVTLLGALILLRLGAVGGVLMLVGATAMILVFAPNSIAAVPITLSAVAGLLAIYSALKIALARRKAARAGNPEAAAKAAQATSEQVAPEAAAENAMLGEIEALLGTEQAALIGASLRLLGPAMSADIMQMLRGASKKGNLAEVAAALARTLSDAMMGRPPSATQQSPGTSAALKV
jgi:hypothetical protein